MNKRQLKKKQNKYLPVIADEITLLTMTEEERKKAFKEFLRFRERFAYRKRYKDLKRKKALVYVYPIGKKFSETLQKTSNLARGPRKTLEVTQSLEDFN